MNFPLKFVFIFLQFCGIALSQNRIETSYIKVKIGGIFSDKFDNSDAIAAFKEAANSFNNQVREPVKLEAIAITVDTTHSYSVQKAVCDMISKNNDEDGNNVVAIFGPNSPETVGLVSSICKKLQLPHFTALWQPIDVDFDKNGSFTRNLFPHPKLYSTAMYQIIRSLHWNKIAFVYDSDDALMSLQQVYPISYDRDYAGTLHIQSVRFHRLPDNIKDYEIMLKNISKSGVSTVVIGCSLEHTQTLLNLTHKVGMNSQYHGYFIANYDAAQTIDFKSLVDFKSNVTTIRFYSSSDLNDEGYIDAKPNNQIKYPTTEAAMISDAIYTFAKALTQNETFISELRINPIECGSYVAAQEPNSNGQAILDGINNLQINGRTGLINFDLNGFRNTFYIEVIYFDRDLKNNSYITNDYIKLARYQCPSKNNEKCDPEKDENKETIEYFLRNTTSQKVIADSLKGFHANVIMRVGDPFLMPKAGFNETVDQDDISMYKGFSIDLFNNLSTTLGFTYTAMVRKKTYKIGKEDKRTGWDGIVKEVMAFDADFAISDITITQSRKRVIDFSISFQTLGISILYTQKPKTKAGPFAFMDPLATDVWLYTGTAMLFVCIMEWLLAKIGDWDWENPHPCDDDPEELENIWDMHNCIWLTIAAFMQQGCDILPKGVPPRLVAVVWWFFALIVTQSYTANLAASLTKVSFDKHFESIEQLSRQSVVRYGLVKDGSTADYFKNTDDGLRAKMWHTMKKENPTVFVTSNDEGKEMVEHFAGKYAFFCETTLITFYTHQKCDLIQVGGKLDSKEYGIAMPMNSPYRHEMNAAILKLKESGQLKELVKKWWEPEFNEKGEKYECEDRKNDEGTNPMGLENVSGIFIVLIVGIGISLFFGFVEFLWAARQTSIEYKITPHDALRKELAFDLRVWKLHKPIAPSSEQNSPSRSSDEEKAEEI